MPEQIEFDAREFHLSIIDKYLVRVGDNTNGGNLVPQLVGVTTQMCPNSSSQFAHGKRLADVVIASRFQGVGYAVGGVRAGQKDDRRVETLGL